MTDIHELQFRVNGTRAVERGLFDIGDGLEQVNRLSGMTDKQLNQVQRQITKAATASMQGARAIGQLRTALGEANAQITRLSNNNKVLQAKLVTTNKRLAEQRTIVANSNAIIAIMTNRLVAEAGAYDKVAGAASRAAAAQKKASNVTVTNPTVANNGGARGGGGGIPGAGVMGLGGGGLNGLRYQLYGVTAAYGILGGAVVKTGAAVIASGIEFDKNFANAIRTSQTTGSAITYLKDQFLELQGEIPVTAEDLATIGTLGSQMGVAAASLSNFTEITAKFSATAGISADESATALSRLNQLLPDVDGNYERLASTILLTGVNAVATEQQIVNGTNQIAAMGRIAGLTTPEIVALASTMSSLGFRAELQRSVVTSSFSRILTATSTVTAQTEKFGAVLNLTGKEFQQAWNQDAIGTYENLLKTIASRGDAVTVLQSLGLASQRLTPNLLKLGQNTEVLDEALGDTARGWKENAELSRQYGIIADTVSARTQVLSQSWDALLVTLDQSSSPLKFVIERLTDIVHFMRDIAKSPVVGTFVTIASVVTAAAGAMILAAAAAAALGAGYIAIFEAQVGLKAFLAGGTLLTVEDTAAQVANTASLVLNTDARAVQAVAIAADTVALEANTVAAGQNAIAMGSAGSGLLRMSSFAISALPAILKWTSLIGLAAAALGGLIALTVTSPDWGLDLQKALNGIDTPQKTVKYDTKQLNKMQAAALKTAAAVSKIQLDPDTSDGLKAIASGVAQQGGFVNGIGGALAAGLKGKADEALKQDLIDTVTGLTSVEEKYAAVNQIAKYLGVTQEDLLTNILPDLGSALGDNAAAMAEEQAVTEKLQASQALWAAALGTSDENLASLTAGVKTAASGFLDFSGSLTDAYKDGGGGLDAFLGDIKNKLGSFEDFYGELGTLVQHGGVQLAGFFASQGPAAAQALTDSLKLNGEQLGQIEEQMSLAAFYASDQFAETFAQNNSLLAQVWTASGHDPKAVAAFNAALQDSMKGGVIDPAAIAALSAQYGINIPVGFLPDIDEDQFDAALALTGATITPIRVPVAGSLDEGVLTREVDAWVVSLEGHSITLPVDPNTDEGRALIAQWRTNEYQIPVKVKTFAETTGARANMMALHTWFKNLDWSVQAKALISYAVNSGSVGSIPTGNTGGYVNNGIDANAYPRFNRGLAFMSRSVIRGPGSGMSDSILARVANGESITNARAVRHYGPRMMDDINKMRFPRFYNGGFPNGGAPASGSAGTVVNATVVQNYPTTRDPIKTLKRDAENVIAGMWD